MDQSTHDKLHYIRIPNAIGGRAEMVRMCYVLAAKPYTDVLHAIADAAAAVTGKNPFKQFPFVETPSGQTIYQTLAIMHHAAHGTPAWPSNPSQLTLALCAGMGGYDLYQAFGGFAADDLAAKKKFEEKRAPQLLTGLGQIYANTPFAAGDTPCFADCIVQQACPASTATVCASGICSASQRWCRGGMTRSRSGISTEVGTSMSAIQRVESNRVISASARIIAPELVARN